MRNLRVPYDLADNKVNAIYTVYKIRKYDSTGTEHNYLFSCGMGDNTTRVYGVAGIEWMVATPFLLPM